MLRQEKNMTLRQLGAAIGISNQGISLMEMGRRLPSFEVLCRLADYFDVSTDYLIGRSDTAKRS